MLVMDEITGHIQEEVLWCMMFVEDIVFDNSRELLDAKVEVWIETLESKDFKISRTITWYMKCNFNKTEIGKREGGYIQMQGIPKSDIQDHNKEIEKDVMHRIKTRWLKYRSVYGVCYDRKISMKSKKNSKRRL